MKISPAAERQLQMGMVLLALRRGRLPLGRIIDVSPVRVVRTHTLAWTVDFRVRA